MANEPYRSRPIPAIIQGVSQQAAEQRRDAQCEEQFDCINSTTRGVWARPGGDLKSFRSGVQRPGAFTYELRRGSTEHYLMVLYNGTLEVYDLNTGALATVTDDTGGDNYLASAAGVLDEDNFRVQTVDDVTFIVNRSKVPAYNGTVTPSRPPEAIVFFEAGNYLMTYTIAVDFNGVVYKWSYTTPDNSASSNEEFIYTNQLAATFYRAMTASLATNYASSGVGGVFAGDTGGSGSGTQSALSVPGTGISETITFSNNGFSVLQVNGATYGAGTGVSFTSTGSLPSNITAGQTYWLLSSNRLAISPGGSPIGFAGAGSGTITMSEATSNSGIQSLGFAVAINGNLLRIWRPNDDIDFTIDVSDGIGGTSINGYKDTIPSFNDLPRGGFDGFVLQVVGAASGPNSDSYWVQFTSDIASQGAWVECPKPNTHTTLDPTTMPHLIENTALDTFTIDQANWLPRISGDGINTSLDPGFVGTTILDLGYFQGRLEMLTAGTVDWSKTNEEFDFYCDTAQAVLDTDPISIKVAANNSSAQLVTSFMVDEQLILWAQLQQWRVNSGVNTFTPSTIQYPPNTTYEFAPNANFYQVETSVYFAYEPGNFARLINVTYSDGRAQSSTDVTSHVPDYIPAGTRRLAFSAQLGMSFIRTDGDPSSLYHYNFLNEGQSVEQSAWNKWRMPTGTVLWQSIYLQTLFVLLQRADGLALLSFPLTFSICDAGETDFLTRLDMRLTEAGVTMAYNAAANTTTITLPFDLQTGDGALKVAWRTTGTKARGMLMEVVSASGASVVVKGNATTQQFYIGLGVTSSRKESQFYLRTSTGVIPFEDLIVLEFALHMDKRTGYTRLMMEGPDGTYPNESQYFPLDATMGSTPILGGGPVIPKKGKVLTVDCMCAAEDCEITLINDSHLPSAWTSVEWRFKDVLRPVPMLSPYGGPVQ